MTIKGHFDGKVVVLDEPAELPAGTRVLVSAPSPSRLTGKEFADAAARVLIDADDLTRIEQAIDEGCERIDPPQNHEW